MPTWAEVIVKGAEHKATRYLSLDEEARLFAALGAINTDLKAMAECSPSEPMAQI